MRVLFHLSSSHTKLKGFVGEGGGGNITPHKWYDYIVLKYTKLLIAHGLFELFLLYAIYPIHIMNLQHDYNMNLIRMSHHQTMMWPRKISIPTYNRDFYFTVHFLINFSHPFAGIFFNNLLNCQRKPTNCIALNDESFIRIPEIIFVISFKEKLKNINKFKYAYFI